MLLPIGALNAHHNQPSGLLFYAEVGWILGAGSNPLHGWPLPDVLEAGVKHQVPKNDLYGMLLVVIERNPCASKGSIVFLNRLSNFVRTSFFSFLQVLSFST